MSTFTSDDTNTAAVLGQNTANGDSIFGIATGTTGRGVVGVSQGASAVEGNSETGTGIYGFSTHGRGVVGVSKEATAMEGNSDTGTGIYGFSTHGRGVVGVSKQASAVEGNSDTGAGVWGVSQQGIGIYGKGAVAGFFEGDVEVTGDIKLLNADIAEDFSIVDSAVEPGTVMVFGKGGALIPCTHAFDKKAVGVISGAGQYKPGMVLDKQDTPENRMPIALMGKVYCKVDATFGSIEIGDLLTSSSTVGHAMKATHDQNAFGSIIGKSLGTLECGRGLIPMLVSLQ